MEGYAAQIGYIVTAANATTAAKPVAIHQFVEPLDVDGLGSTTASLLFSPACIAVSEFCRLLQSTARVEAVSTTP